MHCSNLIDLPLWIIHICQHTYTLLTHVHSLNSVFKIMVTSPSLHHTWMYKDSLDAAPWNLCATKLFNQLPWTAHAGNSLWGQNFTTCYGPAWATCSLSFKGFSVSASRESLMGIFSQEKWATIFPAQGGSSLCLTTHYGANRAYMPTEFQGPQSSSVPGIADKNIV